MEPDGTKIPHKITCTVVMLFLLHDGDHPNKYLLNPISLTSDNNAGCRSRYMRIN